MTINLLQHYIIVLRYRKNNLIHTGYSALKDFLAFTGTWTSKNVSIFCTTLDQTSHALTLNKNRYIIYNIGVLTHRTNISLRHFISQTRHFEVQHILQLKMEMILKFGAIKRENMCMPRIRVKFSDRYKH